MWMSHIKLRYPHPFAYACSERSELYLKRLSDVNEIRINVNGNEWINELGFTFYFIYILVWIVDDSSMTAKNSVIFVIPIHWLWAGSHLYPTQQPCGFCSVLLKENEMVREIYLSKRDTYKLFDKCWSV